MINQQANSNRVEHPEESIQMIDERKRVVLCFNEKAFMSLDTNTQTKLIKNNNIPYVIDHDKVYLKPKGYSGNLRSVGFFAGKDPEGRSHFHFDKSHKRNGHSHRSTYVRAYRTR